MDSLAFRENFGITRLPGYIGQKLEFRKENPHWFKDIGTMIFCGMQGDGKTLSAVNYIYNLFKFYPLMILVSNVALADYPFNAGYKVVDEKTGESVIFDLETGETINLQHYKTGQNDLYEGKYKYICIEYDGLDCLKFVNNGDFGVVFFIDEIHLELNSLESKNIDINVIIEISQQRKQRKKIIGTSQVYFRLAKPLREQVSDIVLCHNFFGCLQYNRAINGFASKEDSGKLKYEVRDRSFYFHTYDMYRRYDTYAKMKRYNVEWKGKPRQIKEVNS